ncbi:MAG: hypothetical protein O3B86_18440, partial [Planctomycetota bacterium]|nr:hypothetical protein [Planctomycetota bacterium]
MFQRRLSLARSRASRLNDSIFAQVAIRIGLALLLLAGVLSVTVGPLAAQDRKSDDKPTFYDPVERNIEG